MTDKTTDREIVVSRLLDAPRELVFAAFTEREHVVNWWVSSDTTTHEFSGEPGGVWRYSMPGYEGEQYSFKIQFVEVDRPSRLVYDYGTEGDESEPVRTIVTFTEENGKTRVKLQLMFATAAEREQAEQYGAAAGAQQALGSLADYLAKQRS